MRNFLPSVNVLALIVAAAVFLPLSARAWDCDERCFNYEACMSDEGARRSLGQSDEVVFDNDGPSAVVMETRGMATKNDFNIKESRLRGVRTGAHTKPRRKLDNTIYSFNLKLYHEVGFCWQGEWDDRNWCADCEGGNTDCEEGDVMEIQYCGDDQRDQRFLYEPLSSGGGRIKPYYRQDLCLERTDGRKHTFEECDDEDNVRDEQILNGFDPDNEFKLIPESYSGTCLSQSHYPKKAENIYAEVCSDACEDKTCYWEITNVEEHGSISDDGDDDDDDDDPEIVVVEGGCSFDEKCPQCYGDCDDDYECEGDLECYKRPYDGAPVPSCSGAEEWNDTKDFCVPPEYNRRK